MIAAYLLYATLRGELLPGPEHVSPVVGMLAFASLLHAARSW